MFSLHTLSVCARGGLAIAFAATGLTADDSSLPTFHSDVDLVSVSFTITDSQGRYIHGLQAADVKIYEDGVEQSIASFADGPTTANRTPIDNSVFVLMDTSNSMYEDFMRASDTVTDFVRGVSSQNAVAIYTFSRNMFRAAHLSHDPLQRVSALRSPVLGDDTAIFNSLLLTIRDAARVPGNKTIVLLSNGPDTASVVSPDDVARVAREEGIPVHVVYTREKDELLNAVFSRVASSTGGQAHVARTWEQQKAAFQLIRDEVVNAYTLAYYPKPSDNEGFRKITIEVVSDAGKRYRVRARPGYKPATSRRLPPCDTCRLAQALPGASESAR